MPKRINDTRLRKQRILKSARKVFLEKGFHGATIDDIAIEEGVVRGTILHYYKSKKLLMEAVLEENDKEWEPLLTELLNRREIAVRERIDEIFALCETCFLSEKEEAGELLEQKEEVRFFRDQIRLRNYYRQTEGLTVLLEEGVAAGEFTVENPGLQAASAMFAVFGITGTDISEEELRIQLQAVKEQLLQSCRYKSKIP
ncbi:MAG: TetR/AcrR family transcriptional regulator [Lachnospiraceae bacterium]|nr:TetR/AcrR family transcriptional regulator [Lachnospiraceae bacterium]